MKITQTQLRQIIKEELEQLLGGLLAYVKLKIASCWWTKT